MEKWSYYADHIFPLYLRNIWLALPEGENWRAANWPSWAGMITWVSVWGSWIWWWSRSWEGDGRWSWSWSFDDNQEDYDKIHGNFCISVWRFALKYIVTRKVIKLRKVDDRIIQVQPLQDSWFTIPSLHSLQILQHGLGIWGNVNDCLWDEATLSFKMFIFSFIALNRFLQLLCQKLMFCHITSSDTQSHQRRNRKKFRIMRIKCLLVPSSLNRCYNLYCIGIFRKGKQTNAPHLRFME